MYIYFYEFVSGAFAKFASCMQPYLDLGRYLGLALNWISLSCPLFARGSGPRRFTVSLYQRSRY